MQVTEELSDSVARALDKTRKLFFAVHPCLEIQCLAYLRNSRRVIISRRRTIKETSPILTFTIREESAGNTLVQRRTCRNTLTRMRRKNRRCQSRHFLPGAVEIFLLKAGAGAVCHNEPSDWLQSPQLLDQRGDDVGKKSRRGEV